VRVRSELPTVSEHLDRLYPGFPIGPGTSGGHFDVAIVQGRGARRWIRRQASLVVNGVRPFHPLPGNLAGPVMEWGLNWCIGTRAHHFLVLHSAVLERGGRALLLPARPGSGKSTLCAALAYSGWRLFSDEFALIDPESGELLPAPRPISLKNESIELIARRYPDVVYGAEGVDIDGARFVHARAPRASIERSQESSLPGWVVFPQYKAGAVTTLERVPKAHALMELAGHSFNYNYVPAGYGALVELIRRTECWTLQYSDLDDVIDKMIRLTAT
jgi:HprK-related kinase A